MSDVDPDLPEWLVDAVLSQEPPAEAVDLVKDAWTWRTVDAELMELTYDSVLDTAGVRDASARRTMEFTAGDISVVIEIDGRTIRGRLSVDAEAVGVIQRSALIPASLVGREFEVDVPAGPAHLEIRSGLAVARSPTFAV